MFDDDYEIDDLPCPACGNSETRSCDCQRCDEMHEISYCIDDLCQDHCIHGDGMGPCDECNGTGIVRWCPKCGADYWRAKRKSTTDSAAALDDAGARHEFDERPPRYGEQE